MNEQRQNNQQFFCAHMVDFCRTLTYIYDQVNSLDTVKQLSLSYNES